MPSQRQLRVGEQIKHLLAESLARQEIQHPHFDGHLITITEVRASPDLRNATVYTAVYGTKKVRVKVLAALNDEARKLSASLGRKLKTKFTPRLVFKEDASLLEANNILQKLNTRKVRHDLAQQEPEQRTEDSETEKDAP